MNEREYGVTILVRVDRMGDDPATVDQRVERVTVWWDDNEDIDEIVEQALELAPPMKDWRHT